MTLYLSNLMSGMLTSRSSVPPGVLDSSGLFEIVREGMEGNLPARWLVGKGVVAERCTEARGLGGREPAVKALVLVCAISGLVNEREARMFGLKAGGDGVRPICRSDVTLADRSVGSSSWWLSARVALVAVMVVVSW